MPAAVSYRKVITLEAAKRGGRPCIRGLRVTVYDVLGYLASGMSQEQILRDLPYLTAEDIRACLEYAADCEHGLLAADAGSFCSTKTLPPASSRP